MSEPVKKLVQLKAAPKRDVISRLEKLEDSFLASLQEIRLVKVELEKHKDESPTLEKLLDAKQVAEILNVNQQWVYHNLKRLACVRKIGGLLRFSSRDLERYIESTKGA
jgi:predicted DNA-binding transcriptional regulator AlpA